MSKVKVFYSYCHIDEEHITSLNKYLVTLKDDWLIEEWYDRKIIPGKEWSKEINLRMLDSDAIIMLVSQDFIASKACQEEVTLAISHNKKIIPIILKTCVWKDTNFKNIQVLPKDWKPISKWDTKEEAWLDIYQWIKKSISDIWELKVKKEYIDNLEKVEFVSVSKQKITLSEIFVWPDFTMDSFKNDESTDEIEIEGSLEAFLSKKNKLSIIKWTELSWKSSVASKIFIESIINGYFPIILDAKTIQNTSNYKNIINKEILIQYNWNYWDYNKQKNKILLIDNYHHNVPNNFITKARENFECIILLIDNEEHLLYFREDDVYAEFSVYSIKKFGAKKQHDLIENWIKMDFQSISLDVFEKKVEVIEDKINDIITKNQIVPKYPFYILSIIQAFEWFMPHDYQITAYWHCYNALILSQLFKKGISPNDIEECFNYLTYLAYEIFNSGKLENWGITLEEYNKFKIEYNNKFIIKKNLTSRIENDDYPIIRIDTHIKFEQSYIYYYFAWKYLADKNLEDHIEKLCYWIYKRDNSNILIFTIHHTNNPKILEEIQTHCMVAFDSLPPTKLTTEDTNFMNSLISELPEKILSNKSVWENIIEKRKKEDSFEKIKEKNNLEKLEKDESIDELVEINKSLKIIEVLWQILKNRAGNLEKPKIQELLFEVEKLGFRILSYFLNTINSQDFKDFIETRLKIIEKENDLKNKYFTWEERRLFIERSIQIMAMSTIHWMINKIFYSVNINKLLEIQKSISEINPYPSFDFLNLLFKLNYEEELSFDYIEFLYKKFKEEKNTWAIRTLSYFLQEYMNTHTINHKTTINYKTLDRIYDLFWFSKKKLKSNYIRK